MEAEPCDTHSPTTTVLRRVFTSLCYLFLHFFFFIGYWLWRKQWVFIVFQIMYMHVYVHEYRGPWRSEEGAGSPGAGHEQPDIGTGNTTHVLYKNSTGS